MAGEPDEGASDDPAFGQDDETLDADGAKHGLTEPSMPLSNDGDAILLIDAGGVVRNQVAYGGYEVRPGKWVAVKKPEGPPRPGATNQD